MSGEKRSRYMRRKLARLARERRYCAYRAEVPCTVAVVDWTDRTANLYGCQPCPRCASVYRAQFVGSGLVECDNCGYRQTAFLAAE